MSEQLTPHELAAKQYAAAHLVDHPVWRHANGNQYMRIAVALRESDLEPMVIYAPTDPESLGLSITWVRPLDEFLERFEPVVHDVSPL